MKSHPLVPCVVGLALLVVACLVGVRTGANRPPSPPSFPTTLPSPPPAPATTTSAAPRTKTENAVFGCKIGVIYLASRAMESTIELELMLATEKQPPRLGRILAAYGYLVRLRAVHKTPESLRRIAQEGPLTLKIRALQVSADIADDWAISTIAGLVASAGDTDERRALKECAVRCAGRIHSPLTTKALMTALDDTRPTVVRLAIESLGNLGAVEATDRLRSMAERPDPEQRIECRSALAKISVLNGPDRDQALLDTVRGLHVGGEFLWYAWALDQIVRLNLTQTAGPLRRFYDEKKETLVDADPLSFKSRLLHAIRKLGGALSAEEELWLKSIGRGP